MENDQLKQAKQLVKTFRKTKERGEFRNKIGRVFWPVVNRAFTYGIPLLAAASLTGGAAVVPTLAVGAGLWAAGRFVTKGLSVNVQNIALKNAALFGRTMTQNKIPDAVKTLAMETYLKQAGAWVFNKKYMKENPNAVDQLKNGKPVDDILNFIARLEHNGNQLINKAERNGQTVTFSERLKMYQKTVQDYQDIKQKRGLKQTLRAAQTVEAETNTPVQKDVTLPAGFRPSIDR